MPNCTVASCQAFQRGEVLYRLNPKGETPAVWCCKKHWPVGLVMPRDDVAELISTAGRTEGGE